MKTDYRLAFCIALGLTVPCLFGAENRPESADEILERALARSAWYREHRIEEKLQSTILRTSRELDGKGKVEKTEERLYRTVSVEDHAFERLIEKDGRPLSEEELKDEEEREAKFRARVAEGKSPYRGEQQRVFFDRRLVDKYDFTFEGIEPINERPAFILAFSPRSADLPVETRMDRALNQASGKIWVDIEEFEVSRVQFHLDEKIKIWWGIIGSISQVDGLVERKPLREGIWAPDRFEIYLKGRILFSSLHRVEQADWKSWEVPLDFPAHIPSPTEWKREQRPQVGMEAAP